MITSRKICSQFEIVVDSSSHIRYKLEPEILAEIPLPYGHQLQVRQVNHIIKDPYPDGGTIVTFRIGYDLLLLKGTTTFPMQISAKIDKNFGHANTVQLSLKDPPVRINVGESLTLAVVLPSTELRGSKVKLVVTVLMEPNLMPPETTIPIQNHLEQISTLLESGQFADCKVVSRDGEEFACHKAILSLKSAVILTAFEVEHMSEAKTGRIQLDCDGDVVKLLLRHFYTGEIPVVPDEILMELYGVAHLYQIESLKNQLAEVILSKMNEFVTIPTVLNTVVFADNYDLKELRQFCLQFIFTNRPEIVQLPEWKDFRAEHLNLVDQMLLL